MDEQALKAITPKMYRRHFARVTVEESGCWTYRSPLSDRGRPRITVNGYNMAVYEFFWLAHRREIVPGGKVLLHSCDRGDKGCVNPAHLSIGTYTDNNREAVQRGRHRNQHTGRISGD